MTFRHVQLILAAIALLIGVLICIPARADDFSTETKLAVRYVQAQRTAEKAAQALLAHCQSRGLVSGLKPGGIVGCVPRPESPSPQKPAERPPQPPPVQEPK